MQPLPHRRSTSSAWAAPVLRSLSAGRAAAGASVTYADESRHVSKYVNENIGTSDSIYFCGPGPAVGPS